MERTQNTEEGTAFTRILISFRFYVDVNPQSDKRRKPTTLIYKDFIKRKSKWYKYILIPTNNKHYIYVYLYMHIYMLMCVHTYMHTHLLAFRPKKPEDRFLNMYNIWWIVCMGENNRKIKC